MGKLHWFLQCRIDQKANFDVGLDQSRYAASIAHRYLPSYSATEPSGPDRRRYDAPLPKGFVATKADSSPDYLTVLELEREYGIKYLSAIGSLLWIINTQYRLQFAIRKLAKFSCMPGRKHFQALMHTLSSCAMLSQHWHHFL